MRRFDDKVVLITGAASGIGAATAERLSEEGARLLLCDVQREPLEELAKKLEGQGSEVLAMLCDVSNPAEVEETVKRHPAVIDCLVVGLPDEKFGQIVAAVASVGDSGDVTADDLREFTKQKLSAFKAPKRLLVVDQVRRAPNGKADYGWAREVLTVDDSKGAAAGR